MWKDAEGLREAVAPLKRKQATDKQAVAEAFEVWLLLRKGLLAKRSPEVTTCFDSETYQCIEVRKAAEALAEGMHGRARKGFSAF